MNIAPPASAITTGVQAEPIQKRALQTQLALGQMIEQATAEIQQQSKQQTQSLNILV
jgi:hypothetical protein